ncbi:hypothetical protein SAMN05216532_5993 [Streptomyces sp. 2231.1]|uniref:hypothetical protein n=1 Tax=Streptomyces sp. 2231.1 TaxID=1855347 RepID=UPI00089CA10E|nr:hypothetical protein [Streptomyces sp. 2231.1]SED85821.1 hypothetical protein SAMN05216532_5993 [Streptomyces sp. 2231.1]
MPQSRSRFPLRRVVGLLAVLAIGPAVTACSSGSSPAKREYATPSSLCGTAVSSSALEPLLPGGKKISSVKSGPTGFARCRLVVDGQVAVTSIVEQWESSTTLSDVAYGTYGIKSDSVEKENTRYVVTDAQAVGRIACGRPGKDGHVVFAMIRKEHGTAGAAAMEKVITEFTDAVSTSKQCA